MERTGGRAVEITLAALCGLIVLVPAADTFLRRDPTKPPQERRQLASCPALPRTMPQVLAFPRQADAWLADHFGLRSSILAVNSRIKVLGLGVAPSLQADVLIGRDGWLYYTGDRALDYMLRRNPFTQPELDAWCAIAEAQRKWLEARGIGYLLVIAPNKESIYPEHLPAWLHIPERPSRADQLVTALHARTQVDVLDLRPVLREAKSARRVFQVTDTHWSTLGAHAAYMAIMDRMVASFPEVRPRPLSEFHQAQKWHSGGDLARLLGVDDILREELYWVAPISKAQSKRIATSELASLATWTTGSKPVVTERPSGAIRRGFFLRDSFGEALLPLLSEHFSRAVYLWWSAGFPAEAIAREKPDILVIELVERTLSTYTPTLPPAQ
jgi:alginate O-acetyltransferase complex protein AlgJ